MIRCIFFLIYILASGDKLEANDMVRLSVDTMEPDALVSEYLGYFYSDDDSLTIEKVLESPPALQKFSKGQYVLPSSEQAVWVKLELRNNSPDPVRKILNSLVTESVFFRVWLVTEGKIESIGDFGFLEASQKSEGHYPRVPLTLMPHTKSDIWIMTKTHRLNAFLIHLLEPPIDQQRYTIIIVFLSIYTGCMLGLGLYNLFLFLSLRDLAYFWYVSFACSMLLSVILISRLPDNLGFQFGPKGMAMGMIFLALNPASALMFCRYFLKTWNLNRTLDRTINLVAAISFLVGIAIGFSGSEFLIKQTQLLNLLGFTLIVISCVLSIRAGFSPAFFYLAAWATFLASVVYWTMGHKNIIQVSYLNVNAAIVGNMLEMILMSFALGQRIKVLQQEKMLATKKAEEGETYQRLVRLLCHDIANPLSVISGFVEMVRQGITEDKYSTYLNKIERATGIIGDMIETVRHIESNKLNHTGINLEAVCLENSIDHVKFIFDEKLKNKKIMIAQEGDFTLKVMAEAHTLSNEVLCNIISNAIKFSYEGSTIYLRTRTSESSIYLEIEDKGVGIPDEILPKIFDNNSQTSRLGTNNEAGTGFGMPLVKDYMETYGGSVEVRSQTKGEEKVSGTTFTLKFRRPIPILNNSNA